MQYVNISSLKLNFLKFGSELSLLSRQKIFSKYWQVSDMTEQSSSLSTHLIGRDKCVTGCLYRQL